MMHVHGEVGSGVCAAPPAATALDPAEAFEEVQCEEALTSAGGILAGLALAIVLWVVLLVPILLLLP
jgi:hypothetical protein